jgi:hypothetical protein
MQKNAGKLREDLWTDGAFSQQNGNAIDDGIAPPAAFAPYGRQLKLQRLMADRADDPA